VLALDSFPGTKRLMLATSQSCSTDDTIFYGHGGILSVKFEINAVDFNILLHKYFKGNLVFSSLGFLNVKLMKRCICLNAEEDEEHLSICHACDTLMSLSSLIPVDFFSVWSC
jgi:hypothetical protein